ncbi:hypothetical protein N0V90_011763 [Kalmusia sp. IMI 367209]|nr:hypothetical protein N0V90_011763 [Kalmusia sp. IMI 367209]
MSDAIPPAPAYFPTSADSPLHPPKELYTKLKSLRENKGDLIKTQDFVVPPRSGRAWTVPSGALFRLSTPEGPQVSAPLPPRHHVISNPTHTYTHTDEPRTPKVGDLNIWNANNPRERFWAARTRQLQSSHMTEGDRLWSNLPFMRPLCGIVEDGCSVKDAGREDRADERGSVTRWGGRCHDLLGTRCDPYGE